MKQPRFGLGALVLLIGATSASCFSREGLDPAPIDSTRPASGSGGRSGGRGGAGMAGTMPGAGGGGAGGAATDSATGGSPAGGSDPGSAIPSATPDAAPTAADGAADGRLGIATVDARPAEAGAPPADTAPAEPNPCADADPALLVCLRFEDQLVDEAPPAANVTAAAIAYEAGPNGRAARVGPATRLRLPAGAGSIPRDFTLEAWVRLDRLPTGLARSGIIDKEGHFGVFILPGGDLACYSMGAMAIARSAVRAGSWASVACTMGGDTLGAWVGGIRRAQAPHASAPPPGDAAIAIGSNQPSGDEVDGLIDNVRIWKRARSAAEICAGAFGCNE